MNKKYQIFVSSTFRDLIEERQAVLEAILELNHIPCGMEAFPANNSTPFEIIEKMIDDSDYYILIIGGKYGSLNKQGISYTEAEYDYAVQTEKHVLCFVHSNPAEMPLKNVDTKSSAIKALEKFKKKVSRHIHKSWTNKFDLKSHVLSSLSIAFQLNPMPGWVKLKDEFAKSFLAELNDLQKKYNELNDKYNDLRENIPTLTHYIKNLRHNEAFVRQEACKALGYMGIMAGEAVPELISTILFDASPVVKANAIEALKVINPGSKEAIDSFVVSLKNKDLEVRKTAAKALGGIGNAPANAVEALIEAMHDSDVSLQACCMEALMLLDKKLYRHIIPVLQITLINRNEELRNVAFDTVTRLDELPDEVLELLIQIFYNEFTPVGQSENPHTAGETHYQIYRQAIKTLAGFEKKGQAITRVIISRHTPGKKIFPGFAKLWLAEQAGANGLEFVISVLYNEHVGNVYEGDVEIISRIVSSGQDIIPVLKKQLLLNPVDRIWMAEPLLQLDSTLMDELIPLIEKASESNQLDTWLKLIHLFEMYDFNEPYKYMILTKAIFIEPAGDRNPFNYNVVKRALKYVLPYLINNGEEIQSIIKIISEINREDGMIRMVQNQIFDSTIKTREVLEAIWNRTLEEKDRDRYMTVAIEILNKDPGFLPVIESWFNQLSLEEQFDAISDSVKYEQKLKYLAPIIMSLLGKGLKFKYLAVRAFENMGPDALPYVADLQRAKENTGDSNLKIKIEDAIRIIEDK